MHITLLEGKDSAKYVAKLAAVGITPYVEDTDRIKDLELDSTDWIYLVPRECTEESQWSEVRTRLAEANRYYVVCGSGLTTAEIIAYIRDGAYDVLDMTDSGERWTNSIRETINSQNLWWQFYGGYSLATDENLTGRSSAIQSLKQSSSIIGPTNASVLIMGESGAGKERVAQAIHAASGKQKFTAVNCAAIPKDLIESELFGVEKGAYTGAVSAKQGLIQEADGGTLFLDEIGELDINLQPKLLRFLETRKARRLGSNKEYSVDLRVITATNRDLELEIAKGLFRSDLYYRISEVILNIPPLRVRLEDIPILAQAFLQMSGERFGKKFDAIEPELITRFQTYSWPGNVRELKQAIDRLVILNNGQVLRSSWWEIPRRSQQAVAAETANPFPNQPRPNRPIATSPSNGFEPASSYDSPPVQTTDDEELSMYMHGAPPNRRDRFKHARKLLEQSGNDYAWVSSRLGIHPTTLYRWRKSNKV